MKRLSKIITGKPKIQSFNFSRVGIVGVGLIGASFGLAIKHFSPQVSVIGVDQDADALERAIKRGAIDQGEREIQSLADVDLIILATPIHEILRILPVLRRVVANSLAIVTDTGSTKVAICEEARKHLPDRFVGGHPMAGSERQGIAGAHPFMFENALYVLTPFKATEPRVKRLSGFLEGLGAQVIFMEPELHDSTAAFVSHLAQLTAVALAETVAREARINPLCRELAAGGFRDLTRIASSPFEIWKDILATNHLEIQKALGRLVQALMELRHHSQDAKIEEVFQVAKEFRDGLPIRSKGFLKRLCRLSVLVPDRIGVLAEIFSALAAEKISVKDIELLKTREFDAGTFHFYFDTEQDVAAAAQTLRRKGFECNEAEY